MNHADRYVWYDLVRGGSAVLVCFSHLVKALFYPYSQVGGGAFSKAFYFISSLGHTSVLVFFVLSGFFVGGSVLSKGKDFSLSNYANARIIRLWVVLIPALILTAFVDLWLGSIEPEMLSGAYANQFGSGPDANYDASWFSLAGNIFFLQNTIVPVFGSNGPLWSLANEFWYYVLFPLLFIFLGGGRFSLTMRGVAFLVFILVILLFTHFLVGFIVWLLGVALYRVPTCKRHSVAIASLSFMFFLCAAIIGQRLFLYKGDLLIGNLITGSGAFIFLWGIKGLGCPIFSKSTFIFVSKWLSEISYSLYLSHFPLVLLIYVFFYKENRLTPNVFGVINVTLWLCLLIAFGFCFWWCFERLTPSIKKSIKFNFLRKVIRDFR